MQLLEDVIGKGLVFMLRREPAVVIIREATLKARFEVFMLFPGHVVAEETGYVDDVAGHVGGLPISPSCGQCGQAAVVRWRTYGWLEL